MVMGVSLSAQGLALFCRQRGTRGPAHPRETSKVRRLPDSAGICTNKVLRRRFRGLTFKLFTNRSLMLLRLRSLSLLLLVFLPALLAAQYASTWANAPIGGGGRTTGFIQSPSADVLYLRTDVAAMYKRVGGEASWTRLVQQFTPEYGSRMSGSPGLAVHPTDGDLIYAALSEGIYKSTDQGSTWEGPVLDVRVAPNGSNYNRDDRQYGEALVIDQRNGEVVYYGSQFSGLYYSCDGGASWTQVPAEQLPFDGSRSVVVDTTGVLADAGTPQARSATVYVSVREAGIYRSTDGGDTFAQWTAELPGGGDYVRWLRQAADGDLYAAHETGLARYDGTAWSDVSPFPGQEVAAVAVDQEQPERLMCFTAGEIYRSTDRGANWTVVDYATGDIPEWARGRYLPGQPQTFALYLANDKLYVNSNYHAWESTTDIWDGSTVTFDAMYRGNEMTINITGTSLPGGRASYLAGMADVRGFKFEDPTEYPGDRIAIRGADVAAGFFTPNFTGIDFCAAEPDEVWFVSSKKPGYVPLVFRSDDAAEELRYVGNPAAGTPYEGERGGGPKIAVSATSPDTAVVMIKEHVRYTHDGGQTWNTSAGIDGQPGLLERTIEYEFDHLLRSDRVNGEVFYIYSTDGKFWRSENAGASFSEVASASAVLPAREWLRGGFNSGTAGGVQMAAAPGNEGVVLLALSASGIWRSSGTGEAPTDEFTEIEFFARNNPTTVTFGASAPDTDVPIAYAFGQRRADGLWGVWLSLDLGLSWELASPLDDAGQWSRYLAGDLTVPGRVFMADASFGIRYLTVQLEDTTGGNNSAPLQPSGFGATALDFNSVELSWFDNADNESGFVLERRGQTEATFTELARLAANTTTYTDSTLVFPEQYTYRLRANNDNGPSPEVLLEVDNAEIIVDNSDIDLVEIVGRWPFRTSTFGGQYIGQNFQVDNDEGKGEKSFTWTTPLPVDGLYDVYARWQRGVPRPLNVPYTVVSLDGNDTTRVNQRNRNLGGTWNLLGRYPLSAQRGGRVVLTTDGTEGEVSADAIRWVYGDSLPPLTAPRQLMARLVDDRVELEWEDRTAAETAYLIERATGAGTFAVLDTVEQDTVRYVDATIDPTATYTYRVVALAGLRRSLPSNEVTVNGSEVPTGTVLDFGGGTLLSVELAPNPVTQGAALQLRFSRPLPASLRISLLDVRGRSVAGAALPVASGLSSYLLPTAADWAPGMYFLRIDHPGQPGRPVTLRVILQ